MEISRLGVVNNFMEVSNELQEKAINTIRFLSVDAVQHNKEGHPGLPMGCAAIAYTIWTRHLRHNPRKPDWFNRDRFVLSGGHGSTLLYSLLHLCGYDISLEEIKKYHVLGSKTPGHPEFGHTPGVDATTGPLGQGFANSVGMAVAEAHLAAEFNRPLHNLIDHYTYAIVTDGDLMEGVASEAGSLAGHLGLGKLIFLYDDNHISIEGSTDLSFTEDRAQRFISYGWHTQVIEDGNCVECVDKAIIEAKKDSRPSLILCRTHIGYGFPTLQDTAKAHGSPPGDEELDGAKILFKWPVLPRFFIPADTLAFFRGALNKGSELDEKWNSSFVSYEEDYPELASELKRRIAGRLPADWASNLPEFRVEEKGVATRTASGIVLNSLSEILPEIIGGSADLSSSNQTWLKSSKAFQKDCAIGRNIYFGIREHAMGAIVNGMAYHKGLIPFGATYLVFTDYFRPAIRLSALAKLHCIWVTTHDSILIGGDGPTHQPVEQIASLRAIPNLTVIRPSDANETVEAWKVAVQCDTGPTLLVLSRQALPVIDRSIYNAASFLSKGAYVLGDFGSCEPDLILMATGSEVSLIIATGEYLVSEGANFRLVAFPSWELFEKQDDEYKASVLPMSIRKRLAVEAGASQGWHRYVGLDGNVVGVNKFGASASQTDLLQHYGFGIDEILIRARELLSNNL